VRQYYSVAAGLDVEQEAAQELLRTESHHSLLINVGIILPAESDLVMLESDEGWNRRFKPATNLPRKTRLSMRTGRKKG
jgi:hypothetical protein